MPRLKSNPPTTAEVLYLRLSEQPLSERFVEWANSMLCSGHDSPSLRILAGEPYPYHDVAYHLVDRTFAELGIKPPETVQEASLDIATERVQQIVDGEVDMGEALRDLAYQFMCDGLDPKLQNFYLLNFAYADLQAHEDQHYWKGANAANIRSIVLAECSKWLAALTSTG